MSTKNTDVDRVISFSYKPYNKEDYAAILKLKSYSKKSGVSFSFLVLKAIKDYAAKISNG